MKASSIHLGNNVAHLRFGTYKAKLESIPDPIEIITNLKISFWGGMDFVFNSSLDVNKNAFIFINRALDIARQSYIDEPNGEEGNCAELIDDLKGSLLFFDDESLNFLIKWPYFRDELANLGYAVDNGVLLYSILENIETIMSEAMIAKRNGIFIPGTGMFVNSNKTGQTNQEQFNSLKIAANMLDDLGFGISGTSYLNLERFEDDASCYATAWRTLGLTDLDTLLHNDLISDQVVSLAQYLGHEDSHHVWDELVPEGVMLDPEITFDSGTYLVVSDSPNEILGEVLANSLDMNFALSLRGKRALDRYRLEEACSEIDRLILGLKQLKYRENMTDQGLHILDQAEVLNRRNSFSVIKKPR